MTERNNLSFKCIIILIQPNSLFIHVLTQHPKDQLDNNSNGGNNNNKRIYRCKQ
jgi:hypothetical protein